MFEGRLHGQLCCLCDSNAHHGFGGDKFDELHLTFPFGAGGALRNHEPSDLRAAVPDLDLDRGWDFQPELCQHSTWLASRASTESGILVPVGRKAEHRPRVTRAERADDEVMDLRGV